MKTKTMTRVSAILLAVCLALSLAACGESLPEVWQDAVYTSDTKLGEGSKTVTVDCVAEDKTVTFTVSTDAETLGEALLSLGLVAGDESEYGLYVKSVNGMTADYDKDGYYWAFYSNGEYMMTGVDSTPISDGEHYELVREKG